MEKGKLLKIYNLLDYFTVDGGPVYVIKLKQRYLDHRSRKLNACPYINTTVIEIYRYDTI